MLKYVDKCGYINWSIIGSNYVKMRVCMLGLEIWDCMKVGIMEMEWVSIVSVINMNRWGKDIMW